MKKWLTQRPALHEASRIVRLARRIGAKLAQIGFLNDGTYQRNISISDESSLIGHFRSATCLTYL